MSQDLLERILKNKVDKNELIVDNFYKELNTHS